MNLGKVYVLFFHSFNFSVGLNFFKIQLNYAHEDYILEKGGRMLTTEQMHEQNNFRWLCITSAQKLLKYIVGIKSGGGVRVGATLC